jgi:hypothetical protein
MGLEEDFDSGLSEVGGAEAVVLAVDAGIGQHVAVVSRHALKLKYFRFTLKYEILPNYFLGGINHRCTPEGEGYLMDPLICLKKLNNAIKLKIRGPS